MWAIKQVWYYLQIRILNMQELTPKSSKYYRGIQIIMQSNRYPSELNYF